MLLLQGKYLSDLGKSQLCSAFFVVFQICEENDELIEQNPNKSS